MHRENGKNCTVKMSLPLPTEQQITPSLSEKDTTWTIEGGVQFYWYIICTCSADQRQTHYASYRYSH